MLDSRNVCILSGRLTRDPEIVGAKKNVVRMGLAVDYSGRDSTDEANKTGFFDVVLFGSDATKWVFDQIEKGEMKKGSAINVLGRLSHNRFESDGRKTSKVEVVAESINYGGGARSERTETGTTEEQSAPLPSRF